MGWWLLRLSAKILALLRLSVNFFQLRWTKKLKINFFCFKELNINKPVFFCIFNGPIPWVLEVFLACSGNFRCRHIFGRRPKPRLDRNQKVQKKNFMEGKIKWKKNSCIQSRPGKKFLHWPSAHFAQISRRQAGKHTVCKTSALWLTSCWILVL